MWRSPLGIEETAPPDDLPSPTRRRWPVPIGPTVATASALVVVVVVLGLVTAGGGSGRPAPVPIPSHARTSPLLTVETWFDALDDGDPTLAAQLMTPGARRLVTASGFRTAWFSDLHCTAGYASSEHDVVSCTFVAHTATPELAGDTGWTFQVAHAAHGPWRISGYDNS